MYQIILDDIGSEKFISICAWCDADKVVTKRYICDGYRTSHGICKDHRDEVLKEYMEHYEKNGFKITNDDDDTDGGGVSIVRGS